MRANSPSWAGTRHMLLSEFIYAVRISACPRIATFHKYEQSNMRGDILNAGYNVDDEEILGFRNHFSKLHLKM